MPRKSLPTVVFSSTPALRIKRPLPSSSEPGRKRRRPGSSHPNGTGEAETTYATANGHEGQVNGAHPITGGPEAGARGGQADEYDAEKELGAWQEFAAEHYEMVEQLPLELHRNFRLLRELDDGCVGMSTMILTGKSGTRLRWKCLQCRFSSNGEAAYSDTTIHRSALRPAQTSTSICQAWNHHRRRCTGSTPDPTRC
jgi:hypothetical protein